MERRASSPVYHELIPDGRGRPSLHRRNPTMIKAVRGTRDLLPPETALWNFVEAAVRDVFRAYNFQEIRTPIFEATELFARGVGEETDIVSKEMFTWEDRPDRADLALEREWLIKHEGPTSPFEKIDPETASAPRTGYTGRTLYMGKNGIPMIIRFVYGAEDHDIRQMVRDGQSWEGQPPQLLLVTLSGSITNHVKSLAMELGVQVEEMTIENFERPQSLTLRPENTAGVVRSYIEHNLEKRGLNKLYYIGPQFRRERPQKGRHRQFYQIGAEVIGPPFSGSDKPLRDAEVLEMLATLLNRLGIADWKLKINSVGTSRERQIFNEILRKALEPVASQMCADCQRRAVTNPLRVLDCKVPADQPIIEKLPRISDYLDDESKNHFRDVKALLNSAGVAFEIDHRLVRGLDYYTRTAFEFTHGALGAQNAILGGGRYDGLSEALGGPPAPGIGFAMGEDRLILALQAQIPTISKAPDAYIAPIGEGMNRAAIRLAAELRRHDLVIELGDRSFRLKKLLETASKLGSRYAVVVGENEVNSDVFTLKNLETGEQISVPRADLAKRIQAG
jgi:histidyl-tRNA synthetase